MTAANAKDRARALEILRETQYLQALALSSTRAQLLRSAADQRALAERYDRVAKAAGELSRAFKERLADDVRWDEVERLGRVSRGENDAEQLKTLWTGIRKTVRPLAAALSDVVGDDPAAAFTIDPVPRRSAPARAAPRTKKAKRT